MRKILLIPLLFVCLFVKAQTQPVNVSAPQKFLRYILVNGSIKTDSTMASTDSSTRVPNTKWLKQNFAPSNGGGYVPTSRQILNGYAILGGTSLATDITKSVDTSLMVSKIFSARYPLKSTTVAGFDLRGNITLAGLAAGYGINSFTYNGSGAASVVIDTATTIASKPWANTVIPTATLARINTKQSSITLTTTGSSGASTFVTNTLNIPTYTLVGLGGIANSTSLQSSSNFNISGIGRIGTTGSVGTTSQTGFWTIGMDGSTGTPTNEYGLYINRGSSSGATATNVYGIRVNGLDYGSGKATTNAYSLYLGANFSTGLNYGIYQASTSGTNVLFGKLLSGSATPTAGAEQLQVTGSASVSGNAIIGGAITAATARFYVNTNTSVISGSSNPAALTDRSFTIVNDAVTSPLPTRAGYADFKMSTFNNGSNGKFSNLQMATNRGTEASSSFVQSGDIFGSFYMGSNRPGTDEFYSGTLIQGYATENWVYNTNRGSKLVFGTTATGHWDGTDVMVIDQNANVGIGYNNSAVSDYFKLDVNGNTRTRNAFIGEEWASASFTGQTGKRVEMFYNGTAATGQINSYDRTNGVSLPLTIVSSAVSVSGTVAASNLSGTNTGNQTTSSANSDISVATGSGNPVLTFNRVLANGVTATTQSTGDNSTNVATTAYVDRNRVLASFYTNVTNSGTSPTDIYSYTTPANTLTNNGAFIDGEYTILCALLPGNTNNIIISFGGQTAYTSGTFNSSSAAVGKLTFTIYRTGTTTARCTAKLTTQAGISVQQPITDLTGVDFTTTNILKAVATGATTADMTFNSAFYRLNN